MYVIQVFVANIGDAKAVVARSTADSCEKQVNGTTPLKAIVLTREHKAIFPLERARIQKVSSKLVVKLIAFVWLCFLVLELLAVVTKGKARKCLLPLAVQPSVWIRKVSKLIQLLFVNCNLKCLGHPCILHVLFCRHQHMFYLETFRIYIYYKLFTPFFRQVALWVLMDDCKVVLKSPGLLVIDNSRRFF